MSDITDDRITPVTDDDINELKDMADNLLRMHLSRFPLLRLINHYEANKNMKSDMVGIVEEAFGKEVIASDGMILISMNKFNIMVGKLNNHPTRNNQ